MNTKVRFQKVISLVTAHFKRQVIAYSLSGFGMIAVGSLICYYLVFRQVGISKDPGNWGVFGDYIGGVVGTIFNVLGVVLIYLTFRKQEEYSHIERFETTFFNLLDNQRDIVKSLYSYNVNSEGKQHRRESYEYIIYIANSLEEKLEFIHECVDTVNCQSEIDKNYLEVYSSQAYQLGHYFRHLYHIIKYIDEGDIANKKKYTDIVQAQMSDSELYITFYNSLSNHGFIKLYPLLKKYHFFENITSRNKNFDNQATLFYPDTNFKNKTPALPPSMEDIF